MTPMIVSFHDIILYFTLFFSCFLDFFFLNAKGGTGAKDFQIYLYCGCTVPDLRSAASYMTYT